jgi:hypothetical protein
MIYSKQACHNKRGHTGHQLRREEVPRALTMPTLGQLDRPPDWVWVYCTRYAGISTG